MSTQAITTDDAVYLARAWRRHGSISDEDMREQLYAWVRDAPPSKLLPLLDHLDGDEVEALAKEAGREPSRG